MAQMNRHLDASIETIFLMPSHTFFYTSSHIVKQVWQVESSRLKPFVPANVLRALRKKYAR
jgi:pantetheine-phosphate adenylyltransferase